VELALTNSVHSSLESLLVQARGGDAEALGELLERHRGFLKVLAQRMLSNRVQARLDASDVVQKTCLSVQQGIGEFRGESTMQFLAWLRQIHEANIQKALREHLAQKRDIAREGGATAAEIESLVADSTQPTPSQRILRDERAVRLAAALEHLPEDQREAVRLRYLEGLSLAEVGQALGRSDKAASALILRGIATLRKRLDDHD
jgi:RNA polymerase sigma-70 factor (ECF subfamily)